MLGERVHFTDRVPHQRVPGLVRRMDIGVLPDTGFYCCPLNVLEWMAAGLAIVAPRYECLHDIMADRREGLLFEPKNLDALVESVLSLLLDEERRTALGAAASKRVQEHLTWKDNAARMIELCQYAMDRQR